MFVDTKLHTACFGGLRDVSVENTYHTAVAAAAAAAAAVVSNRTLHVEKQTKFDWQVRQLRVRLRWRPVGR